MGAIYILDSGYVKPTNAGTQASSANRANSGSAIVLQTADFVPSLKRNINNSPEIGSNTPSEVNLGSIENMQFQLTCRLNTKVAADMAKIQHLLNLIATDGYKFLWYQYSTSAENNNGQLIYQIALNSKFGHQFTDSEKTAFSVSDNFYHLHVHFFDIQPRQTSSTSHIVYTLSGIVMKVEVAP